MNEEFDREKRRNIEELGRDRSLRQESYQWMARVSKWRYSYNFSWLGRPIIQFPQDIVAIQEIIWAVKPDVIVETGVAHGGSLIFHASILELIGGDGQVLGIDVDIRNHNRKEIERHPMHKRISMIQGSSVDSAVAEQVHEFVKSKRSAMIVLDSMHTHDHVRKELELYSGLVTKGSYLIVLDTIIEDLPEGFFPDRPWGKGNNPKTAVWEFLRTNDRFVIDEEIQKKLLITVAPDGYLKCVKD